MGAGHLRHIEMHERPVELTRQLFGEVSLASAGRSRQQKDADRLAADLKGEASAELVGHVLAHLILPDDPGSQVGGKLLRVDG